MNKNTLIAILASTLGAIIGIFVFKQFFNKTRADRAKLEQVIITRQLHLVKHIYEDTFFLHKKDDPGKNVQAIAQVPVYVSAFINLDDVEFDYTSDSTLSKITIPRAELDSINYLLDQVEIKPVRKFKITIGGNPYIRVLDYISSIAKRRKDRIMVKAVNRGILTQTEQEAKSYITSILASLKLENVQVEFEKELKVITEAEIAEDSVDVPFTPRSIPVEDDEILIAIDNLDQEIQGLTR